MIQGPTRHEPEAFRESAAVAALRSSYRGLRMIGLSEAEAGNLSAHLAGLGRARSAWQLRQIERLLFLRALVERGRLEP
jgi:hypothetical protein